MKVKAWSPPEPGIGVNGEKVDHVVLIVTEVRDDVAIGAFDAVAGTGENKSVAAGAASQRILAFSADESVTGRPTGEIVVAVVTIDVTGMAAGTYERIVAAVKKDNAIDRAGIDDGVVACQPDRHVPVDCAGVVERDRAEIGEDRKVMPGNRSIVDDRGGQAGGGMDRDADAGLN